MEIMVITNTGYQLSQDKPYDPYSLLQSELSTVLTRNKTLGQSELSTVLTRNKTLGQQISINVGINTLATTNPDDYGWNALGAVTGTVGANYVSKFNFGNKYGNQIFRPILSGITSEALGSPSNLLNNKPEVKYENK